MHTQTHPWKLTLSSQGELLGKGLNPNHTYSQLTYVLYLRQSYPSPSPPRWGKGFRHLQPQPHPAAPFLKFQVMPELIIPDPVKQEGGW